VKSARPGLLIAELVCALNLEYEDECDEVFPVNPWNSELGILAHFLINVRDRGRHDTATNSIVILDLLTGLPLLLNGRRHYPLSTSGNAQGNHSLPFHFGFRSEWPTSPSQFYPELVNVKMELSVVNR
jgi:hypothetical protein